MPRAKQRTPELRERLVDVAVETLAESGVAGFTARSIAAAGETSVPAVYELFGDKAGLVREVFFAGFRLLGDELTAPAETDDPGADLDAVVARLRAFGCRRPELIELMFGRPFVDFDPGPDEAAAGATVRTCIVGHVQRCIDAGVLEGDATDISHALLALVQGLVSQENAGWLGTSRRSIERRWSQATAALLRGYAPGN